MDLKTVGLAALIAAAYVAWPNLAKPLGLKPGVVPIFVVAVGLIVVMLMSYKDIPSITRMSPRALAILLAFSLANGLAICVFSRIAADQKIQTSMFLATVFVLQVSFAPIADWLINGSKPSSLQYLGLGLAVPVLWLLSQKR